ncbi:LamG-like jellyroll fold domain-containing protein [Lentzea sp. CA-135723]|uniref:LamG-like jellyroll fold domain-containing protein n=1 Tax=Lentzea sp. CA-135723 TaxID=3239950 RepID=UPI003D91CBF1
MARSIGWRRLAAGVAVALGATAVTVAVLPEQAPRVSEAADAETAVVAAQRQGEAVAVADLTTATKAVFAQPDGTLTAELSSAPTRTFQHGRWVDIDPALVESDGVLVPKAAGADLTLSNGGKTPLLRFGTPGRSAALTWPGELPKPAVNGDTATYADVLPGVDLVLRTQNSGVTQHVVVKDPKANAGKVRFGLVSDGLTVKATDEGGLKAVDANGEVLLSTPPAIMWDAAGKQAEVGLEVDAESVTLVPDQALLASGSYPVTIDPDWYTNDRKDWLKNFSGKPDSKHWYGANDVDTWAKVGRCVVWDGCNGIGVARSYFQFDTSFLRGKRIISSEFSGTSVYSPSCRTVDHQLWIANATFGPDTNWNNQPGGTYVDTSPVAGSYRDCPGNKPVGFDVGLYINPNGWSAYYLQAASETDDHAWRKYDANTMKIRVNYNSRPDAPVEMVTDPPLKACRWCGGIPFTAVDTIRLKGRLGDAEKDQLTAIWDVYGGPVKEHQEGPTLGAGNVFSTTADLRGRDGQHVTWTLWGRDSYDGSDWKNGPGFKVDRVGITAQPGVDGGVYQADERWHGGVGVPGRFTFDAAGVSDVDHYVYGWNDPPSTPVDADALGGKAVVDIAPTADGPQTLYVRSVDRAGNQSPTKTYRFYVRAGNGPLAQWSLDGNAKDSASLGDRHGTLTGGASYTASGAVGSAVQLNDPTGAVTAANTVRTDQSFTVSAWVRQDRAPALDTFESAVSQDGQVRSGFFLGYRRAADGGGRWEFVLPTTDGENPGYDTVNSASAPQLGQWTHLVGVYNVQTAQIQLFVNGELRATAARTGTFNAAGQLVIGRGKAGGGPAHGWSGSVDEVKVHDRVLTQAEVRAEVGRDAVQTGNWKFEETSGATADNAVSGAPKVVLQNNARFVADGAVGGALKIADNTGYATAGEPVVRTDQSFSVSAWVRQDRASATDRFDAAVSQDGPMRSGFCLGYRKTADGRGQWEFVLPTTGTGDAPGYDSANVASVAKNGEWAHLTGVYDAQLQQIRLYVNGELAASAPRTQAWNATGPFLVGRGKAGGLPGHDWEGSIDEVRVFNRVISPEEVRGIVSRDNVAVGSWKFDGTVRDSTARGLHGTTSGTVAYVGGQSNLPDPSDQALQLGGATSVSTPHGIDTDRSFAVAAWARADATGQATVLSQDGTNVSGLRLRARPDGKWGLSLATADAANTTFDEAAGGVVQAGQWTHLVGVHDASAKQILLYVNGVLVSSVAHTKTWNAAGGLQIGRAKQGEFFQGAIDDVSAYSRTLFAAEIQTMSGKDLSLVHNYTFDDTGADAAGNRPATLSGDAVYGAGRVGRAVTLDGAGAATTGGVDLRLDQAFTVSAWVRIGAKPCAARVCRTDAVTVDGAKSSKFRLGHVIDDDNNQLGAWTFEMPESDVDNAPVTKAAVSVLPSEVDRWTLLVGVYDPVSKKIWLYVDGTRDGDGTLTNAWHATGPLAVGRGKVDGAPAEHWTGGVDDVRLYTGQLDKDRISGLFRSYPSAVA